VEGNDCRSETGVPQAMSSISVNTITDASGGNTATINGYTPTMSNMAGRNRIINGNFEIWQRGNTSRTFGSAGNYSADRWCRSGYQSAAHELVTISSPVVGMTSRYALKSSTVTTAEIAGGSRMQVSQKIESVNCYDLAGQNVTFSFWIRFSSATISSSTGAFGDFQSAIQYNTSTTDASAVSDLGDGTIGINFIANGSLPTTWTKFSTTALVPASTKNLTVRFQFSNVGNTASAGSEWFEIAEVQLEAGSVATPFEHRQYGTELALCQRYYWQRELFNYNSSTAVWEGYFGGGTGVLNIDLPVVMRASPTLTVYAPTQVQVYETSGWTNRTISSQYSTPEFVMFNVNSTTHAYGKLLTLSGGSTIANGKMSAEL